MHPGNDNGDSHYSVTKSAASKFGIPRPLSGKMQANRKDELKIAVICSSNMNRSMEAHAFLAKKGYNVESFGTGDKVKLPGSAPDKPNVYDFGTTYEYIYQDLLTKDKNMYTQNGLLHMLDRNRRIKPKPEKFQLSKSTFSLIITCEERVYDQALDHLDTSIYNGVWKPKNTALHLVNIDIQDNHEEATIGAFLITELVAILSSADDLDNEIDELLLEFESKHERQLLHSIMWQ